jgi:cytochrome c oxidase cbb3-type subunit 3
VWLWGGTLAEIEYTIQNGVRSGVEGAHTNDMPAFGRDEFLTREQISDLVEYVTSLSGGEADPNAVRRSAPLFAENCASCHGDDGRGGKTQGAPNLTDAEWLYGGDRATIRTTINGPRGGVMPAWKSRLDPATVRALAVYVHSMGGGS